MAAVKKLIEFAKEKGLENVAKVLESAYVDDCNSSVATREELEEIKQKMPDFMSSHGMPIKALAWTGEEAPEELSANGLINTAGYSWDPKTDAGFNASMMVFYIGKQAEEELKLEFVFSIGNLNHESGIIPRNLGMSWMS